jgi:Uma2 family endonuclease
MSMSMNQATLEKRSPSTNGRSGCRHTVVLEMNAVHIPDWVVDLASFRRWADLDEFPEKTARICYLAGEVWIDMSWEQVFTHNQIKGEVSRVLSNLMKDEGLGRFFPDGIVITNVEADFSCKPDGVFVSRESFEEKGVRLVEGAKEGFIELEGTPDMVLEVISASSVTKDTVTLRELYHHAGIPEYWLVDARAGLEFDIFRYTAKGYTAARKQKGWVKSHVFGRSFQLTERTDALGQPEYTLQVQ